MRKKVFFQKFGRKKYAITPHPISDQLFYIWDRDGIECLRRRQVWSDIHTMWIQDYVCVGCRAINNRATVSREVPRREVSIEYNHWVDQDEENEHFCEPRLDNKKTSIEKKKQLKLWMKRLKKRFNTPEDIVIVTLKDAISAKRIVIPVRIKGCKHIECFDYGSLMTLAKTDAVEIESDHKDLKCPFQDCKATISKKTLISDPKLYLEMDSFFLNILSKLPKDAMAAEIFIDGTFKAVDLALAPTEVVDLELCEEGPDAEAIQKIEVKIEAVEEGEHKAADEIINGTGNNGNEVGGIIQLALSEESEDTRHKAEDIRSTCTTPQRNSSLSRGSICNRMYSPIAGTSNDSITTLDATLLDLSNFLDFVTFNGNDTSSSSVKQLIGESEDDNLLRGNTNSTPNNLDELVITNSHVAMTSNIPLGTPIRSSARVLTESEDTNLEETCFAETPMATYLAATKTLPISEALFETISVKASTFEETNLEVSFAATSSNAKYFAMGIFASISAVISADSISVSTPNHEFQRINFSSPRLVKQPSISIQHNDDKVDDSAFETELELHLEESQDQAANEESQVSLASSESIVPSASSNLIESLVPSCSQKVASQHEPLNSELQAIEKGSITSLISEEPTRHRMLDFQSYDPTKPLFVITKNGNEKLIFEGYCYNIKIRSAAGVKNWSCTKGRYSDGFKRCKGKAKTCIENGISQTISTDIHSHCADHSNAEFEYLTFQLYSAAISNPKVDLEELLDGASKHLTIIPKNRKALIRTCAQRMKVMESRSKTLVNSNVSVQLTNSNTIGSEDSISDLKDLNSYKRSDVWKYFDKTKDKAICKIQNCKKREVWWIHNGSTRGAWFHLELHHPEIFKALKCEGSDDPAVKNMSFVKSFNQAKAEAESSLTQPTLPQLIQVQPPQIQITQIQTSQSSTTESLNSQPESQTLIPYRARIMELERENATLRLQIIDLENSRSSGWIQKGSTQKTIKRKGEKKDDNERVQKKRCI